MLKIEEVEKAKTEELEAWTGFVSFQHQNKLIFQNKCPSCLEHHAAMIARNYKARERDLTPSVEMSSKYSELFVANVDSSSHFCITSIFWQIALSVYGASDCHHFIELRHPMKLYFHNFPFICRQSSLACLHACCMRVWNSHITEVAVQCQISKSALCV